MSKQATVAELVYKYLASVTRKNMKRLQRGPATNIFRRQNKRQRDVHRVRGLNLKNNLSDFVKWRYSDPRRVEDRASSARSTSTVTANYAKAVSVGRKRARTYICKALSLGVYSGYLVPTDSQGKVLRVLPDIKLFAKGKKTYKGKRNAKEN